MSKSQKELAFLRDLTVTKDWTDRFTNFTDKHLKLPKEGNFLYFNAGTLSHALELREKFEDEVNLVCICDNAELKLISEAKSNLMKARIKFADLKELESESFDEVLADLSFVRPNEIGEILDELVFLTKKGGKITFFLPTAGSFGEIFSYLWETFLDIDLVEKGAEIEKLISEIVSISDSEKIAKDAGLKTVISETNNEIFEYETGKDFISSTLLSDFLFPVWLHFLSKKKQNKAIQKMAQLIDNESDQLTFRFSVKATLVEGVKK
ncbi:MAG: hypothetical protein K1X72_15935 [Pyrinomonadaceae bacterium]|nr:hypothetical protein [Pyrinomonadaceae bacterium]